MRLKATSLFVSLMLVVAAPSAFADEGDGSDDGAPKAADRKIEMLADFVLLADSVAAGEEPDTAAVPDEAALVDATASVTELRAAGIGWGALFKIYMLAAAMGVEPSEIVGEIGPDGEYEFAFGELKKGLDEERLALLEQLPKNFGSLVSATMRSDKAADKAERDERKAEKMAERDARKAARDTAKAARGSDA